MLNFCNRHRNGEDTCLHVVNLHTDIICLVFTLLLSWIFFFSLCGQATAQCWYAAETAGGVVFPGSVLLPAPQALHPGRHGGSGEPRVQQQEDRTYPNSLPVVRYVNHIQNLSCSLGLFDLGAWLRFYRLPPLRACKFLFFLIHILFRWSCFLKLFLRLWRELQEIW